MQYLPVAPLSPVLVHVEHELEADEAEAPVVASLVRTRSGASHTNGAAGGLTRAPGASRLAIRK